MGMAQKKSAKSETKVVSFRLAADLHKILEDMAKGEREESGLPLNTSGMARRLVISALDKKSTKSK